MSPVPRRAARPGIIRLDASRISETIEVRHDGALVLSTDAPDEVARLLSALGVANPAPLVEAVRHFDAVEIDQTLAHLR